MLGKLYGIGIGVGDKEMLTLKAIRILESLDVVIVPEAKSDEGSTAYSIVQEFLKKDIQVVFMEFPMIKDTELREKRRKENSEIVEKFILQGKKVGFLTIGDSMTYSTYIYLFNNLKKRYSDVIETIPGISSFVDIGSRFNVPLVVGDEDFKVISMNSKTDIQKEIENNDNIVFMKISRNFKKLKEILKKNKKDKNVIVVSNSGKDIQKVYYELDEIDEDNVPYFTTLIYKKGGIR